MRDDRLGRRDAAGTPSRATSAPAARRSPGWPASSDTSPEALAAAGRAEQRRRAPRPRVRRPRRAVVGRRGGRARSPGSPSAPERRSSREPRWSRSPSRSRTSSPRSTARSRRSRRCWPTAGRPPTASLMQLQADTSGRRVQVARCARALGPRRRRISPASAPASGIASSLEALDRSGEEYAPAGGRALAAPADRALARGGVPRARTRAERAPAPHDGLKFDERRR